jgi:site-specific recombinase XerD
MLWGSFYWFKNGISYTIKLSAILFLYRYVLKREIGWVEDVERAKKPSRLPVVFTKQEVDEILLHERLGSGHAK